MKTKYFNFGKNFTANAEIADLEKLGWTLDFDENNDEEKKENNEKYHVEITVNEEGKTFWRILNTSKYDNGINEGSDNEETGDDKQTIKDLNQLHEEGKLWNEKNIN